VTGVLDYTGVDRPAVDTTHARIPLRPLRPVQLICSHPHRARAAQARHRATLAIGRVPAVSRWRPPAPASTAIITREGFERLRDELNELWKNRRPDVVKALADAAAEGDRSENAEYTYRKKQLGEIDRRVRYLSKRLESLKVVERAPADPGVVFFGAWIELEDDAGDVSRHRIVGPDETDAARGWISIDSPLARAALGKRVDDEFDAPLPAGMRHYVVVAVEYAPGDA
jgi:transcription elongation factor GreB